jgi:PAS domain S-box-containing protein
MPSKLPLPERSLLFRLTTLPILLIALLLVAGAFGLNRMHELTQSLGTVFRDRIVPLDRLRRIRNGYGFAVYSAFAQVTDGALDRDAAAAQVDRVLAIRRQMWSEYLTSSLTKQERQLVARAESAFSKADDAVLRGRALVMAQDASGLRQYMSRNLTQTIAPAVTVLDELMELQVDVARVEAARSQSLYHGAVWTLVGLACVGAGAGGAMSWVLVARYVRERLESEAFAKRQATHYQALSRMNAAMVRASEAQALFVEICRICAHTGLARVASILLLDEDHMVTRGVVEGSGEALPLHAQPWSLTSSEARHSAPGQALLTGRRIIRQDYSRDAFTDDWCELTRAHGIRGVAALPFTRGTRIAGVLVIYADRPDMFTPELVGLLDGMASDLSFALDHLDVETTTKEGLERFRLLFDRTPLSTVILENETDAIVEVNDAMCRKIGFRREELIGRTARSLGVGLLDEDRVAVSEALARSGRVFNMECRLRIRGGEIRHFLMTAEPIRYRGVDRTVLMGLDVTERHIADEARRHALAAETANLAKTQFLSRMSHELRTPLNAVLGFAQLLQSDARGQLTPQQLANLGHIRNAGWHLLQLINDVLDVSRIEAGRLTVVEDRIAIKNLLREVLRMSEPLASQSGINIGLDASDTPPLGVLGDPMRLRQVVLNLVSNAVKYNRPGGSVRVQLGYEGDVVHVDVVDTGIGMTREQLEHLYEPFNRLGRERGGIEGTGIGLSITRQLVRLMHGTLAIESETGVGTRARVTLRRADIATVPAPETVPAPLVDQDPTGVVLYVEDNPVNSILVEQLLSRWSGVHFVVAEDGGSGIELANELHPDIVLLDMQLPDMSGIEVLRALRSSPVTGRIPVVALSASAMQDEVDLAKRSGATDYWTKPLDFEQFLSNTREMLLRRRAH